jgi:hypothetical protein
MPHGQPIKPSAFVLFSIATGIADNAITGERHAATGGSIDGI